MQISLIEGPAESSAPRVAGGLFISVGLYDLLIGCQTIRFTVA